jgi:hypothetical protein
MDRSLSLAGLEMPPVRAAQVGILVRDFLVTGLLTVPAVHAAVPKALLTLIWRC